MDFLFKDQCVTYTTVGAAVETDDTITSDGYKVKVNGSYVTAMRGISPVADAEVDISIEDLIETPRDRWVSKIMDLNEGGGLPITHFDDFIDAEVEFYTLVFNKNTGVTTETLVGNVPFNNIIHGVFGNRFPQSMVEYYSSYFIWLGGKFKDGGHYRIHRNALDFICIIPKQAMTVRITALHQALSTVEANLYANQTNIVSVKASQYAAFGSAYASVVYKFSLLISGNIVWSCTFEIVTFADHRRLSGSWYDMQEVDQSLTLYFEHPNGGLDCLGNLNLTGINVGGSKSISRLQKPYYRRGGNASQTHIPSQHPNVFTTGRDFIKSESNTSYSYECIMYDLDYEWLGQMRASKRAYFYRRGSSADPIFTGVIELTIQDVSVSIERDENSNIYHVVSVQVQEVNEIYS